MMPISFKNTQENSVVVFTCSIITFENAEFEHLDIDRTKVLRNSRNVLAILSADVV